MSESMIERVAAAMEANFKEVVAFHAGISFEKTKVEAPAKDVWLRYARAAIEAMRELPEEPGPRYSAGEYSRRTHAAMIEDALGPSWYEEDTKP